LSDVSFSLASGEAAVIMGPSGSGKSSLLYILGALEPPTEGGVTLDGQDPFALTPAALASFRNASIGFVFQDHCLLPQCTVLENVLIPTLVGARSDGVEGRADPLRASAWQTASIIGRLRSGGERQRVAVDARSSDRHGCRLRRADGQSGPPVGRSVATLFSSTSTPSIRRCS
jgi:lipoprotein-releasing system ATP-binding protein